MVPLYLEQLKQIRDKEKGIVLRQVARLNTREHLIASWFERESDLPKAFTNAVWRMELKPDATEQNAKALLALLNSKVIAYIINLFSTNNHVNLDELNRVPIPNPQTLPATQLASLTNQLLAERASLENDLVAKYGAKLPEFDDKVYVRPSAVLASSNLPKVTIAGLVGRDEIRNIGPTNGRIKALRLRNSIICTITSTNPNAATFSEVLDIFLKEPEHENDTWSQAQNWQLPEPIAAAAWLNTYNVISQQAQAKWERFVALQHQVDDVVADWYGFDSTMRAAIAEGLPWAKRRRNDQSPVIDDRQIDSSAAFGITNRVPVTSSRIYAIGYDMSTQTLEVEFLNKDIWQYQNLPLEEYQKFEAAPSKGQYYTQKIKGKYSGKKL